MQLVQVRRTCCCIATGTWAYGSPLGGSTPAHVPMLVDTSAESGVGTALSRVDSALEGKSGDVNVAAP